MVRMGDRDEGRWGGWEGWEIGRMRDGEDGRKTGDGRMTDGDDGRRGEGETGRPGSGDWEEEWRKNRRGRGRPAPIWPPVEPR